MNSEFFNEIISEKDDIIHELKYILNSSKEVVLLDFLESLSFSIDDELGNPYSELSKQDVLKNLRKYIIDFKVPVKSNDNRKVESVIMTDDGNRIISLICDGQYVEKIDSQHIATLKDEVLKILKADPTVLYAVDLDEVAEASIPEPIKTRIINGYNWQRSGDIQVISHDGMLPPYSKTGTTHSVWNSYDSHIPLIFMGTGIKNGQSNKPHFMTDIAPTLAQILKIENPSGNIGNPIPEVTEK